MDLARIIESESEAEVIISEVITRSDKTLEDLIRTVNKLLSRYCNQNGWQLLRHNNISKDHLNDGGLQLNDQGLSVLVTNLTSFDLNDVVYVVLENRLPYMFPGLILSFYNFKVQIHPQMMPLQLSPIIFILIHALFFLLSAALKWPH